MDYEYFDGCSGAPIVRMNLETAKGCSGSGRQDDNVAAAMSSVEWIADADTIRRYLDQYGVWDDVKLADDEQNRHRALWLAACDIVEEPDRYRL